MSSRYLLHPNIDDLSKVLGRANPGHVNPGHQLLQLLTFLIRSYPPQDAYSSHECHGLYSGPTSIAYLFLQLSRTNQHLNVSGHGPLHWAGAYLTGHRSTASVTASKNGVINEKLAFHAVRAALTQDLHEVKSLVNSIKTGVLTEDQGSDESLYGRAGCLYLLRLIRFWVQGSDDIVKPTIEELVQIILDHGPSWPWHGKDYLGAVHGRIGIVTQIILCDSSKASSSVVLESLEECLRWQLQDGNWPSSIDSGHDHLVQFCHGAPGFVISFKAIQSYFSSEFQERMSIACEKAREVTFNKGLLTKEPNLCHGSTGNALALLSSQRELFMAFTTTETILKGKQEGWYVESDDPYGLFCGMAGRAWLWALFDSQTDNVPMIAYDDV